MKLYAAIAALLAAIAFLAPAPDRQTDRDIYEATANRVVIPDCTDLHCFRVVIAWVLGVLPGPPVAKWKLYAAISNAAAAVVLGRLCLVLGLSRQVAAMSTWAAALGFGSLYTLFDPFSSDALMYLMGPLLTLLLLRGRLAAAGWIGAVGVLGKEFAAAPLYIFTLAAAIRRQWPLMWRALATANAVLLVWLGLQFFLMLRFNYQYGDSASTHLLSGGNLLPWFSRLSPRLALSSVFTEYGALWLLAPIGFCLVPSRLRHLAIAAVPAALAFAYVQQPDRALWNFHYLMIPMAIVVVACLPSPWAWTLVGCFAFANLRLGAQLTFIPAARVALLASVALAVAAAIAAWRARRPVLAYSPAEAVVL